MDSHLQPGAFAPTRWTLVLRARGNSSEASAALGELCEGYWTPIFRFLCREGREEDVARELTQEFFAQLLAKRGLETVEPSRGRFRSFLLGALKHFLGHVRERERAAKRGGGQVLESLDAGTDTATSLQIPDPASPPPDTFFDRQWALALMDRAFTALEAEFKAAGKIDQYAALKPWLVGETPALSQAEAGRRLGMNEGAVKVSVHRLRRRFREMIRSEIAQTVDDSSEVDEELRYLVEVLSHAGN